MGNSMKKEVQVILEVRRGAHGLGTLHGVVVTDGQLPLAETLSKAEQNIPDPEVHRSGLFLEM